MQFSGIIAVVPLIPLPVKKSQKGKGVHAPQWEYRKTATKTEGTDERAMWLNSSSSSQPHLLLPPQVSYLFWFYVYGCSVCTSACVLYAHIAWCLWEPERCLMPRTGVRDGCELPCEYWEPHPGPLEGQPVLLPAKPSLQPSIFLSTILVNFVVYYY